MNALRAIRINTGLSKLVFATGIFLALIGISVIIGWLTKSILLIQIIPSLVPMQFNTALCFLFSGLALISANRNSSRFTAVLASFVGVIGSLTLLEYLLKINIGIDQLFLEHFITTNTTHPGRMAPNTALSFTFSSIALFLSIGNLKKTQISGVLGSFVFALGLIALLGYLTNVNNTSGWGNLTKMAPHTAFSFLIIGSGLSYLSWLKEKKWMEQSLIVVHPWLIGYAFSIGITVFILDLSTPIGLAEGVLYILLTLFATQFRQKHVSIILAIISTILIVLGFYLSPQGSEISIAVINRLLSILAVWITAFLVYSMKVKEQRLKVSNDELGLKNKELEQFAYIASHDLQEPLRTTTSMVNRLHKEYSEKLDTRGMKYMDFILEASGRMSGLIKGLLDFSRLGAKKEMSEVNASDLVAHVLNDLSLKIEEQEAEIIVATLPTLQAYEVELRLLFQNLISNALKFKKTDTKPVISIAVEKIYNTWKFSVKDNGIGIKEEYLSRIFLIFQQLHPKNQYEGSGIGLAHCQKVVKLHGGDIWVVSTPGEGSTFYFTIPIIKK